MNFPFLISTPKNHHLILYLVLHTVFSFCSGDGTMSAFNVRRRRFDLQSEHVNSELLCASLVKVGSHVMMMCVCVGKYKPWTSPYSVISFLKGPLYYL